VEQDSKIDDGYYKPEHDKEVAHRVFIDGKDAGTIYARSRVDAIRKMRTRLGPKGATTEIMARLVKG
jgi:hypothetical protein